MSEHTINLRSENPALLVEFNLPPATHARVGGSPQAEISIPLAGLADFAGMIGRDDNGRLYLADSDGQNPRYIELPAAFPLPPYHFVVFHPSDSAVDAQTVTTKASANHHSGTARRRVLAIAAVIMTLAGLAALIVTDRMRGKSNTPPTTEILTEASLPSTPAAEPSQPVSLPETAPTPQPEIQLDPKPAEKIDLETLAERVAPAVFRLEVKDIDGEIIGTGTAFSITADGLAVTSYHVIEKGESYTARTTQGAEFTVASVTAIDPAADLALIAIKASHLPHLELGESESLRIGAPVAVFGSPSGLSGTLSAGILSARRTESEFNETTAANGGNLLQITAPISPGSSGSPVFDQHGRVIGVAAAVLAGPAMQNLNFVIPVEAVNKLRTDSYAKISRDMVRSLLPPRPVRAKQTPEDRFQRDKDFPLLKSHFEEGNWIESLKIARAMASRHPESSSAAFHLAMALDSLELHDQAETSFIRGLEIAPDDGHMWFYLGLTQLALKKVEKSQESFKRAAGIIPDNADLWFHIALVHLSKAEYREAVVPIETLRKLDPAALDTLIIYARTIRNRTPALKSLLDRFDEMPPVPLKALPVDEETGETAEQLATSLVAAFLKHGEGPHTQREIADYAPVVEPYFDRGRMDKARILDDIMNYRKRWPQRTLELAAIESVIQPNASTIEATYRLKYSVSDGQRNRSGTHIQKIQYTQIDGRWLVSGIQTLERLAE